MRNKTRKKQKESQNKIGEIKMNENESNWHCAFLQLKINKIKQKQKETRIFQQNKHSN